MKHELYTISERSPTRLIINRKRSRFLLQFISLLVFFIAWTAGFLNIGKENEITAEQLIRTISSLSYLPFIAASLFILFQMGKSLYLLLRGDKIIVDKLDAKITKSNGPKIDFSEIDFLQIRKYTDSDGDVDYRLSIIKLNGEKSFIDRSSDRDGIIEFAEELGDFLSKEIKFK